jgi:signal transduction histidine kinase
VQKRRRREAEDRLRASEHDLRTSYERIRDLGQRLLVAQDAERSRIARELHDDVGQQVALLAVDLEFLGPAGKGRRVDVFELSQEALDRAQQIAKTVHDISHRLHPEKLRLIGLVAALGGLCRELSVSNPDIRIELSQHDVPEIVPPDLTTSVYRVAQEVLQNAVKHSGATQILAHLAGHPGALTLSVEDNGLGFDVDSAHQGLGLISIRERVEPFHGTVAIQSAPGTGTRVEISLPLPKETAPSAVEFPAETRLIG